MPHLPAWMHHLRPFAVPIWVAIGILAVDRRLPDAASASLRRSRSSTRRTSRARRSSTSIISGVSFALVAVIGVPVGVVIAQAGRMRAGAGVPASPTSGRRSPASACSCCSSRSSDSGVLPTVIALVVYGLLPVLRNTVAGIQGVDPAAVDAARGMGMTRWQALMRVQLPLASPLVFAGLRTCTRP